MQELFRDRKKTQKGKVQHLVGARIGMRRELFAYKRLTKNPNFYEYMYTFDPKSNTQSQNLTAFKSNRNRNPAARIQFTTLKSKSNSKFNQQNFQILNLTSILTAIKTQ